MAYAVREGDPTSTGGYVMFASATQQHEERKLARMGDPVWCPACEKVGYIAQGNPTFIDEYIAVATQGHDVQCGCERGVHTLIATQQELAADMDAAINIPEDMAERSRVAAENIPLERVRRL